MVREESSPSGWKMREGILGKSTCEAFFDEVTQLLVFLANRILSGGSSFPHHGDGPRRRQRESPSGNMSSTDSRCVGYR